jgi:hypothetical protein
MVAPVGDPGLVIASGGIPDAYLPWWAWRTGSVVRKRCKSHSSKNPQQCLGVFILPEARMSAFGTRHHNSAEPCVCCQGQSRHQVVAAECPSDIRVIVKLETLFLNAIPIVATTALGDFHPKDRSER